MIRNLLKQLGLLYEIMNNMSKLSNEDMKDLIESSNRYDQNQKTLRWCEVNKFHINKEFLVNYEFDSNEELYFYHWMTELYIEGYIDWIYIEEKSYLITNEVKAIRKSKLKTKVKEEQFVLSKKRIYTPDFIFKFNKKAYGKFYYDSEGMYERRPYFYCNNHRGLIYVDTKGAFVNKNMSSSYTFPDRQSIMCDRYGIYVQKIVPYANSKSKKTLFSQTFTPNQFSKDNIYLNDRLDKKTGLYKWRKGDSKLKYPVRTLQEYLC